MCPVCFLINWCTAAVNLFGWLSLSVVARYLQMEFFLMNIEICKNSHCMGWKVVCSAPLLNHFSQEQYRDRANCILNSGWSFIWLYYDYLYHSSYICSLFIKLNLSSFDPIFGRGVNCYTFTNKGSHLGLFVREVWLIDCSSTHAIRCVHQSVHSFEVCQPLCSTEVLHVCKL